MKKLMTLVMSAALAFFASASLFAKTTDKYWVTINKNVEGCKSVSFEEKQFADGAKVTIKAVADKGYVFAEWSGDINLLNEDPRSATATFKVDGCAAAFEPVFKKIGEDYIGEFGAGVGYLNDFNYITWSIGEDHIDEYNIANEINSLSLPTVSVKGLPAGVKYDAKTGYLTGKPTKAGHYIATVSVKNASGYTASSYLDFWVNCSPVSDNYDYDKKFYKGEVIDSIELAKGLIGCKMTGLPAGLKFDAKTGLISGKPTKAGRFAVTVAKGTLSQYFTMVVEDDTNKNFYLDGRQVSFYLDVQGCDYEDYVTAGEDDEVLGGSVTGAGIYSIDGKINLSAKANSGNVFAFWNDQNEQYEDGEKWYRTAKYTDAAGLYIFDCNGSFDVSKFIGVFIPKTVDDDVAVVDLEGVADPVTSEDWGWNVCAHSVSPATLTVKGLPAGFGFESVDDGDPDSSDGFCSKFEYWFYIKDFTKVTPGEYKVQITAKNASGQGETEVLTISVPGKELDEMVYLPTDTVYDLVAGQTYTVDDDCFIPAIEGVTLTAKNLPAGLKLTKGPYGYYITGTPTAKSDTSSKVEVTAKLGKFTANGSFFVNVQVCDVTVDIEGCGEGDDSKCGKVNFTYKPGAKSTAKATAAKDHVFAGWYCAGSPAYIADDVDYRTASISFAPQGDTTLVAKFVTKAEEAAYPMSIGVWAEQFGEDSVKIEDGDTLTIAAGTTCEFPVDVDSLTLPTVTVKGLPAGLKYNAKTSMIEGIATKAVEDVEVTISAKNASKSNDASITIKVTVLPMTDWAVGTFNGGISLGEGTNGIFTATVKNTGAISGKVTINGKSASFSAKNFDFAEVVAKKHKHNSVSWRSLDNGRINGAATGSTTRLGQSGALLTRSGSFEFFLDPDKDFVDCDPYVESYGVEVTIKVDGEEIVLPLTFAELNKTVNYEAPDFNTWNGKTYITTQFTFRYTDAPAITEMSNQGDDVEANVPAGATYWVEGAQLGCCYSESESIFLQSTKANFDAKKGYDLDSVVKSSHALAQIKEQLARYGAEFVSLTKAGVLKIKGPDGKSYTSTIAVTDVVVDGEENYTEFIAPISTKDVFAALTFSVGERAE